MDKDETSRETEVTEPIVASRWVDVRRRARYTDERRPKAENVQGFLDTLKKGTEH